MSSFLETESVESYLKLNENIRVESNPIGLKEREFGNRHPGKTMWRHWMETAFYKVKREFPRRNQLYWHVLLGTSSLWNCREINYQSVVSCGFSKLIEYIFCCCFCFCFKSWCGANSGRKESPHWQLFKQCLLVSQVSDLMA